LLVGSLAENKPGDHTIFYANIEDSEVYLAGWTVSTNRLTNGTIGQTNSFGIYPSGITAGLVTGEDGFKFINNLSVGDSWVMTAG
jgi:hypothetical protein